MSETEAKLRRELQACHAVMEEMHKALNAGMTIQGEGDVWSVQPDKMRTFKTASVKALASFAKLKSQKP